MVLTNELDFYDLSLETGTTGGMKFVISPTVVACHWIGI